MSTTFLTFLHKHRETCRSLAELEMADLDRQIAALERARPRSGAAPAAGRENERGMLRVMQAAGTPLPPREISQYDSVQKVATGRKAVTLALRVARLAGVPMDEPLAGQWLSPRTCPHCGHPPEDFVDEETIVE